MGTTAMPPLPSHCLSSPHHQLRLVLQHCNSVPHLKQIHARILRSSPSIQPYDILYLNSRLVHFSAISDLSYATRLLDAIQDPNSFIFNTLIRAYACTSNLKHHAILLYIRMLADAYVVPDKFTFPFVLKACAYLFAASEGKQIHSHILKLGFSSDTHVNNSLIHFYATCGFLELARNLFDEMPDRTVVSWNIMIDGYVRCGQFATALELFREVQKGGFGADGFTMQSVVCACGGLGSISLGIWSHLYVMRKCENGVAGDVLMNNSLIDMYAKCGSVRMAWQLFEEMPERDVASWNAMIFGFAMHGYVKEALDAFSRMCITGKVKPNSISFVGVLTACSHGGLVGEGRRYFHLMVSEYKIAPQIEHYGCVVNLLARAGLVEEAMDVVSAMPIRPDVVIWRSLLDACCKRNAGVEISELMAQQILELDGGFSSGVYVLLSRVYASANQWNDVGIIRRLMFEKGVTKEPGCSSIELDGIVHEFLAGDSSHPRAKEIYDMLRKIEEKLVEVGYEPDTSQAPMISGVEEGKERSLWLHSERLAIAFGLLNLQPSVPIRVLKNLRVCSDCHTVTKLISKVFDVEIIVRDRTRFHRFKGGACSCMDYW
ncbi:pentatricopeptide repeat-containing protein At1g59720, chloroplastic/mitochondrial [Aristolochia californica]|uniref:pentatricopeptide repeat-containing protein At1g59720, chloroplastic/mitochondrial n=1 Tax=Aristolochia californica TaxID=171875 RepID=UPI0035DBD8CB